jgi:hypothetical protein
MQMLLFRADKVLDQVLELLSPLLQANLQYLLHLLNRIRAKNILQLHKPNRPTWLDITTFC